MAVNKTVKKNEMIADATVGLGAYRSEAYEFLREGLDYTVGRTHGSRASSVRKILGWLEAHQSKVSDLPALLAKEKLPPLLVDLIEQMGGVEEAAEQMNLHVDGEQLCWGLRDLAVARWGLMSVTVLGHWGIRSTRDFGRMVFALVEQGLLAKQSDDDVRDFEDVFEFDEAFDRCFAIDLNRRRDEEDDVDEAIDDE